MRLVFLIVAIMACYKQLLGQAKMRKLPNPVNHPSINVSAPFVSLDGNSMIFIADNAEDNMLTMNFTSREGVNWKQPVMMSKTVNSKLNFLKGFALAADGKTLYLTNQKFGGIGGFDILVSELKGAFWSEPINIGAPVNSKLHDGCPSVTVDGNTLYFMRCEKMDVNKADNCKLMVVKKKPTGRWDEPVELPASINTGNSQVPRIMGDGETLIFSSNKFGGNKGGMDLYMTRLKGNQWSTPVALDFANSTIDDQYVSASSLSRYLMKDAPGQRTSEIIELLFPADKKPIGLMKVEGKISGLENSSSAYIAVFNQKDQSRAFNGRPLSDGSFVVYMKEGEVYDLSVEPEQDNYTFYSKQFDVTGDRLSSLEKIDVILKKISFGDEIELPSLSFDPYTKTISSRSAQELRRVVRLIKGNASYKFNIDVTLFGLQQDSVQSNPDLSEIRRDTTHTLVMDSIVTQVIANDSLSTTVDSVTTVTRDSIAVKVMYHNDRTAQQAESVRSYLIAQGILQDNLTTSFNAIVEALPENKRTKVKLIVRQ
ncbi:MAG: PD40 domain-containing protein [Bacteroidia bacterium]|nr:PD40 domain-containing protein [Bacteroidia bacterium]